MAHDSGLDDETLAGGTPDDFPPPTPGPVGTDCGILFAVGVRNCPILGIKGPARDGVIWDMENYGNYMDSLVPYKDIRGLTSGFYLWTGDRRVSWGGPDDDHDIFMEGTVTPATLADMIEFGLITTETPSRPGGDIQESIT